jgi:hypothetical protein
MNRILIFLTFLLLVKANSILGQTKPLINVTFSKFTASYDFVQKLSNYYPDNEYKKIFKSSEFNTDYYIGLLAQLDTLNIQESLPFQGYPYGQKSNLQTLSLLEKNLINASSIDDFKKQSFGIIPNDQLFALSNIISSFEPVYDRLIYLPNKKKFEKKLEELRSFVQKTDLSKYFEAGQYFYGTQWDNSIPIDIAIIPSISNEGFTASAFLNNAISEVPLSFKENDILFCVLMHEIFHLLYDGQSLELKQNIEKWFQENPSKNSQYAYLLLNEVLATALGNGFVFEGLNGTTDKTDWYNVKYINLMAQKIYTPLKEYISRKKSLDQSFIDQYIKTYDEQFSEWSHELEHLLTYRYILSDDQEDFNYFRKNYRYTSNSVYGAPIDQNSLEKMKQTPITKVIIVSNEHKRKLNLIKNTFIELEGWKFTPQKEFVYTTSLRDKTRLIIINICSTKFEPMFESAFKKKRID